MRAVVQRVLRAQVVVEGVARAEIDRGLFVLLGLAIEDDVDDLDWIVGKIQRLRVFDDDAGQMNLSVAQVGGSLCVVSQFTLLGDVRRGNRPSYSSAMPIEAARAFWPRVEERFIATGIPCAFGEFQAMMTCGIVNDGPVTLWLDSADRRC